jgi:hypothetical protein
VIQDEISKQKGEHEMKAGILAITAKNEPAVIAAAIEHLQLKARVIHPGGTFDSAKRWYPDTQYACCEHIRCPSRAFPFSLIVHCRTVEHVASMYEVDAKLVRSVAMCFQKAGALSLADTEAVIEQDRQAFLAQIAADAKAIRAKARLKIVKARAAERAKIKAAKVKAAEKAKAKAAREAAAAKTKAVVEKAKRKRALKSAPRCLGVAI